MRQRTERRGFTMVETLVAMGIVALSVAFLPVFMSAGRATKRSQHVEQATRCAQQQLEGWRQAGYGALPTTGSSASSVTRAFTPPATLPNATGEMICTRIDANLNPTSAETYHCRLQVRVSWQGVGSDRGTVTLSSVMTTEW